MRFGFGYLEVINEEIINPELRAVIEGQLLTRRYSTTMDIIIAGYPGSYYRIIGESHNPVKVIPF